MAQTKDPDQGLVKKAARGDRRAFTALFDRHFQAVYNYALMLCRDPALAEDLTQEAFIRAHKNLDRFGPPWNFRTWIYRLAHNYFIDLTRRDHEVDQLKDDEYVRSAIATPEKEAQRTDTADRVRSTLEGLRLQHREILMLRELHGFSYAEIGGIMDISDANVKVLLHRARGAFQDAYGIQLLLEDPEGDCQEIAELLPALHDQEDLLDKERLVKEHLKVCKACQRRKQWLVDQSLVLGALVPLLPPEGLAKRILQQTGGGKGGVLNQRQLRLLRRGLGFGGAAGMLGAAAWLLISYLGGGGNLTPDLIPASSGGPSPAVLALELPASPETESTPPPPPPAPPMAPSPTPTEEPEALPNSRCTLFQDLDIKVVLLSIPEETMVLPLYLKMAGGIPCLGVESPDVQEPCDYGATLGNIEAYSCGLQGFEDRLYCLFRVEPELSGQALDLALTLNECPDPVFSLAKVTIPEVRWNEELVCREDLKQAECEAAGGTMSKGGASAAHCICP